MRVVKKKREIVVGEISTPGMADIAFQLIIFFLLTTVFMHEHGLRLVLPEKGEEVRVKKENIAEVYVNARGQVKIKDMEVPVDRIREFAEQLLKEN
ncbi:biopolymer transporter ExbD, partial [archaeon]